MYDPSFWHECDRRILARLDIVAAYEDLGIVFSKRPTSPFGWRRCRGSGSTTAPLPPLAVVCVSGVVPGRYREQGTDRPSLPLWGFAARAGRFAAWRDARRHYAKVAGIELPSIEEPLRPVEQFLRVPADDGNEALRAWCRHQGDFDFDAVKAVGGWGARRAGASPEDPGSLVAAFPVFAGPEYLEGAPAGLVVAPAVGKKPPLAWATGGRARSSNDLPVDGSLPGLLGRDALARLRPPASFPQDCASAGGDSSKDGEGRTRIEIVWVVEGLRNLLTLNYHIRCAGLTETHVAVAVSPGSPESLRPEWVELFQDRTVLLACHQDDAGHARASRYREQLISGGCREVRTLEQPVVLRGLRRLELAEFLADATYADLPEMLR